VNDGWLSVTYQVGIAGPVKADPIRPADWQMSMLSISPGISCTLIIVMIVFYLHNKDSNGTRANQNMYQKIF